MTNEELNLWLAINVEGYTETAQPDDHTATEVRQCYKHTAAGQTEWRVLVSRPYHNRHLPTEMPFAHSWTNYNPTINPAIAMGVLKKCADRCAEFSNEVTLTKCETGEWAVSTCWTESIAETLELAICKFAYELFKK